MILAILLLTVHTAMATSSDSQSKSRVSWYLLLISTCMQQNLDVGSIRDVFSLTPPSANDELRTRGGTMVMEYSLTFI